ncbi:2,3-bisphosphoglycerate-independent phosphoglycerate mutase [Algoriphagus sediminis]|uniref:2,3-bisphosphoglycerate-independent phosphoglycerate mutase n=1 Tax=Algoriphagus sediminis TaxID=3057113 RepID=A0ABT7YBM1_9BACT|nr:2,3-bisphosphoglycerate-independent phosphoglycerate mutase [Algoriphagus sediminis]MDN3203912.1 2,3-bisphosphoglycerate-independent phosphoglycerate mutase [Algoriphagus sediminis]
MEKKVLLMILDGWGLGTNPNISAIAKANTPYVDSLFTNYPHAKLDASGLAVGLPEGQMGNSEVGHMNIGAGRVVYQDLVKINQAVENEELKDHQVLIEAFKSAQEKGKKVHFMGLVSDGGVHAHIKHLKGLCDAAKFHGLEDVFIHAFTDGRDTDPKSGIKFIEDLEAHLKNSTGQVASVIGRYYAMDRDNRWERVKLAYDAMVKGEGERSHDIKASIRKSYDNGVTDEFIRPIIHVNSDRSPIATIEEGDLVLCFNFRTDRGREITQVLTQKDFPDFGMKKLSLDYITFTNYDDSFKGVKVLFEKDNLKNTLGEVLERNGKKQIRIAETEKYPHVTFFFSGGRETEFDGESRILCPSPKVATYDLQPEMSAFEIASKINVELKKESADFICLNFANADMVGHTGVFEAAMKACEAVDQCTKSVIETALANGYSTIVIADHGNSDVMVNPDGSPNTAHTTNLVPFIFVDKNKNFKMKDGKLGDLAPTILNLMGIDIPEEMTGKILISK